MQLWDIAGIDGLQVMKTLFGQSVDRIAPFQSIDIEFDQTPCSILRLCEGNFRIRFQANPNRLLLHLKAVIEGQRVWLKQFPWLESMVLPEGCTPGDLAAVAIAKPPFQLQSLALHCAAPTRIEGLSVLVWYHPLDGQNRLELQLARTQFNAIAARLTSLD